ncbi:MAG TPA: hypothetical protein PK280_16815 [Planctomycetota bacterium]|nr:hypothetical protein [Planctomycetota bacterium]
MPLPAMARPLSLLVAMVLVGCLPPPKEREDPVAETMRMLEEGRRPVQGAGGGASPNILVRIERIRAAAADEAGMAGLWRYADEKLAVSGRDGLAAGGIRLGAAGPRFEAELSAWSRRASQCEKERGEIVVMDGRDGLLSVTRSALVPVLRVVTPSGEVRVLENVQVGAELAVKPRLSADGRIELELHPVFSAVSGQDRGGAYSLDALSTKVTLAPGQKLLLGAHSSATRDSAAMGLFGYDSRGAKTVTMISVSAERL